ncbi:MAG: DUF962 domain-containing protein [Bdellovibrionaceae bacterium]|nr:DUF962 domain-containing protein [Pseudobdellovibrionaceae bacterium]
MEKRFRTFREFYPFYLSEHASSKNRALHFAGLFTALSWVFLCAGIWERPGLAWAAIVIGYGAAWLGHFVLEKNKPATFQYPLYSLMGDFRMAFDIIRSGRLDFDRRT